MTENKKEFIRGRLEIKKRSVSDLDARNDSKLYKNRKYTHEYACFFQTIQMSSLELITAVRCSYSVF